MEVYEDPPKKINCPYCGYKSMVSFNTEEDHLWICTKCKKLYNVIVKIILKTERLE